MQRIVILFFLAPVLARAHQSELVLAPGESLRVSPPSHAQVILANGKIAKVRELGRDVQITGQSKGQTRLSAGDQSWSVIVLTRENFATYRALERALRGMVGLELVATPEQVIIQGELLRWRDWQELKEAAGANLHYQFAARLSEALKRETERHVIATLQQAHLPLPSLQFEPHVLVQLPDSAKAQLPDYQLVLQPFGIEVDVGHQLVELQPMIRVKIVVAEVKRFELQQLGVQWPDSLQAGLVQPAGDLQITGPDWIIRALEGRHLGKVLASPNLLCRSGKSAEFLAGGEFPIRIKDYHVHDVVWKRHGVALKIQPNVDLAGNMSVALETEVSMIDPTQAVDGIPGLLTNRIQTHFDLKHSQTIALSGLIKKEWAQTREGLPWLTRIPVLGALFSSQEYQDNKTELVIFVTPEVMNDGNALLPMPEEMHDVH
jgi:pilus assembly protein CpaC